jgi:hypothetical protein
LRDNNGVTSYAFGGWAFWLIAIVPFLHVGGIVPGLLAGNALTVAESLLDVGLVAVGVALLAGRFTLQAATLSRATLSLRVFPFLPPRKVQLHDLARVNWVSGSTLGLNLRSTGDTSASLMLMSKQDREDLVDRLRSLVAA